MGTGLPFCSPLRNEQWKQWNWIWPLIHFFRPGLRRPWKTVIFIALFTYHFDYHFIYQYYCYVGHFIGHYHSITQTINQTINHRIVYCMSFQWFNDPKLFCHINYQLIRHSITNQWTLNSWQFINDLVSNRSNNIVSYYSSQCSYLVQSCVTFIRQWHRRNHLTRSNHLPTFITVF